MKNLYQFLEFKAEEFFKDKRFKSLSCLSWEDNNTGLHLGTKVELVIIHDGTVYQSKTNKPVTNLYEKVIVKVPKDIDIPFGSEVKLVAVKALVYGEFKNQLSVTADDVVVVTK